MNTNQTERRAAARYDLHNLAGGHNHPDPDPNTPIDLLDPDHLADLTEALLEDWDNPGFTELGLCRAHKLSLVQIRALAAGAGFQAALTHIRALRAARAPDLEARTRALAIEGLSDLARYRPANATFAQQIRIALQALLRHTTPSATSPDRKGGDGFDIQPEPPPDPTTDHPTSHPDRNASDRSHTHAEPAPLPRPAPRGEGRGEGSSRTYRPQPLPRARGGGGTATPRRRRPVPVDPRDARAPRCTAPGNA